MASKERTAESMLHLFKVYDTETGCVMWKTEGPDVYDPAEGRLVPGVRWGKKMIPAWKAEWHRVYSYMPDDFIRAKRSCDTLDCLCVGHITLDKSQSVDAAFMERLYSMIVGPTNDDPAHPNYYLRLGVQGTGHLIWQGAMSPDRIIRRTKGENGRIEEKVYKIKAAPTVTYRGHSISVRNFLFKIVKLQEAVPPNSSLSEMENYLMTRAADNNGQDLDIVPKGYIVVNTCGEERCVSPQHSAVVHRGNSTGSNLMKIAEARRNQTHCKRGHEFTPENTYVNPSSGSRVCKECRNDRMRSRRTDVVVDPVALFLAGAGVDPKLAHPADMYELEAMDEEFSFSEEELGGSKEGV